MSYPEHVTKGFRDTARDGEGRMELQHVDRPQGRAEGKTDSQIMTRYNMAWHVTVFNY